MGVPIIIPIVVESSADMILTVSCLAQHLSLPLLFQLSLDEAEQRALLCIRVFLLRIHLRCDEVDVPYQDTKD